MLLLEAREQVLPTALEDYLVIDISRIHHELDAEAEVVLHNAADNVRRDVILGMAQMGIFIHCRATAVPCHRLPCRVDWDEVIIVPRKTIVDLELGQLGISLGFGGGSKAAVCGPRKPCCMPSII